MKDLAEFDREEIQRLKELTKVMLGGNVFKQFSPLEDFMRTHDARRDAMMREELLGRMPKKVENVFNEMEVRRRNSFIDEINGIIASVLPESGLMDISSLTK